MSRIIDHGYGAPDNASGDGAMPFRKKPVSYSVGDGDWAYGDSNGNGDGGHLDLTIDENDRCEHIVAQYRSNKNACAVMLAIYLIQEGCVCN